jgi:hypothetical protein
MKARAMRARFLVPAAALLAGAATSPAGAETLSFKADLAAIDGTSSKAAGTLTAEYDTSSKKLTWRGNYHGLSTYATAANLHGTTNRVVVRLRNIDSPFEGAAIVSERQAADLIAGRWYVLVLTAAYPNGELRGQITRTN